MKVWLTYNDSFEEFMISHEKFTKVTGMEICPKALTKLLRGTGIKKPNPGETITFNIEVTQ